MRMCPTRRSSTTPARSARCPRRAGATRTPALGSASTSSAETGRACTLSAVPLCLTQASAAHPLRHVPTVWLHERLAGASRCFLRWLCCRSSVLCSESLTQVIAPSALLSGELAVCNGPHHAVADLSMCCLYCAVQNTWEAVTLPAANREDALTAMTGHAACAVRGKVYMFGGRQGRKYLRRTFVFDTGAHAFCSGHASMPDAYLHC
jgi:hypothetical protein